MASVAAGVKKAVDVVVVGLGPVGITLCTLLADRGLSVLGIDARDDVFPLPRAIGMDHEVMRTFQAIGVASRLADSVGEYRDSEYRSADGTLLRRFIAPPLPHQLGWPAYLTFVQPPLERALRAAAAERPTLHIETGVELVALDSPVTPRLTLRRKGEDEARTIAARYVIGCDGGSSFVRRALGIAMEDLVFDQPWLVIDVVLKADLPELPSTNVQFCNPARPHTYVVLPGQLRRWEFMMLPGETPEEMTTPERLWSLLAPWVTPESADIWRSATYRFHALVAESWREGQIFLAGDACHMTPPFLAQGMVQGIKDAANLAWKLASAIDGRGGDRLLDSYEAERRPLVRDVIAITKGLGQIICETDPAAAAERDAALLAMMREGKGTLVRQDLFPPIRDGVIARQPDGEPWRGSGRMCPQPRVRHGSRSVLLDDLTGNGFTLVDAGLNLDDAVVARLDATGIGRIMIGGPDGFVAETAVLTDWLARHDGCAALVRPDRVVFGVAKDAAELALLLDQLNDWIDLQT